MTTPPSAAQRRRDRGGDGNNGHSGSHDDILVERRFGPGADVIPGGDGFERYDWMVVHERAELPVDGPFPKAVV